MNKYLALFSVISFLSFVPFIGVSDVNAQAGRKIRPKDAKPAENTKQPPPASKLDSIQRILQARLSKSLVAGDPCQNATPIAVGQTVDDALQSGDCVVGNGTLIDFYDLQGTSGQAISISMNSSSFDTYLYLFDDQGNVIDENDDSGGFTSSRIPIDGGVITLPYTGDFFIGANSYLPAAGSYSLTVNSPAVCAPSPIPLNQAVNGTLANTDCAINIADEPYFTDLYAFKGTAGQQITVYMSSGTVDSYLVLHTPSGEGDVEDDDSGGGVNALIPASGTFTLTESGTYIIEASTADSFEVGPYTITLTASNAPAARISDFDGDGRSDISVWRPSDGNWYWINSSNSTVSAFHFGSAGDQIVPGDYDGDGTTDFAVFRAGTWYIWGSTAGFSGMQFGLASDLPAQGDFDGDGKTDIAVFRPSNGTWYIQAKTAGFSATQFGALGDRPVVGDYDGDGKADIAVYRPTDGNWYQLRSTAGFAGVHFGTSTDKVVPGDYDGDGKTDLAVYRDGSPGTWYLLESTAGFVPVSFGTTNDIPVPGDFDGDGKADVGVFRSSNGTWYLQRSTSGFSAQQFGATNDKPAEAAYVPTQ